MFVALSLVLPLVVLYFVVRWAVGAAREILDERYARGQIDREEYARTGRDIEEGA